MLTTRCPNCQTTFRVTSSALHKAVGKVRCGQCSEVFNAFDSLADTQADDPAEDLLQSTITEVTTGEADEQPIPNERLDAVLESQAPEPEIRWYPSEPEPAPEQPLWRTAAVIAGAVLALQLVHYSRAALTSVPVLGGTLEQVYALIGLPIIQEVDPADFTIVNWVATAQTVTETDNESLSALEISAGVRNTSDAPLPYPMLSLELTDRWEKTIGARVFTPAEYTGTGMSSDASIRPKSTVSARLQLVDPGPDAYGFEVDICVAVDDQRMRCSNTDNPFR